jgi:hypothetical protein
MQSSQTTAKRDKLVMVKLPISPRYQLSAVTPTSLSIRDAQPLPQPDLQSSRAQPDPLDGSLGPFLVSCALVTIVILVICSVFWAIHRRSRLQAQTIRHAGRTVVSIETANFSLFPLASNAASSDLMAPPSRLRIRSPIQRLRLLRTSSQDNTGGTIPLFADVPELSHARANGIPEIVLSHPSPAVSDYAASPSLTTSSAPSVASLDNLQIPHARWVSVRPAPLIQLGPTYNRQPLENRQPSPKLYAKINSVTKSELKLVEASKGRVAAKGASKKAKGNSSTGKENMLLQSQPSTRNSRKRDIFGSRYSARLTAPIPC